MPPVPDARLLALLLLAAPPAAAPIVAQERDTPMAVSVGMVAIPAYQLYNGRVNLSQRTQNYGGQYRERTAETVGVQASFAWESQTGDFGLAAFAAQGPSQGDYTGLSAPETHVRDLLTVGLDLGWRPAVLRGGWGRLMVPFGPTVTWQRLRLSRGHRDAYASPAVPDNPEVTWSDRDWLSFGGHAGVVASIALGGGLALQAGGTARFVYYGQGAWSGQEESDIQRSGAEAIHVGYEDPIILLGHAIVGLEWRPGR